MSKIKIELNRQAVGALLKSPEVMAACASQAAEVVAKAGGDYETSEFVGKTRVNVSISATSEEAIRDNDENGTLKRIVGAR